MTTAGTELWWSWYARRYDRLYRDTLLDLLVDAVRHRVGTCTGHVLDAGTGTGLVAAQLASAGGLVIGMDTSAGMLSQAAGRAAVRVLGDVRHPPFAPRTFEAVVAANVLHLAGSPGPLIEALVALLQPGGRLVLCWPHEDAGPWRLLRAERRHGTAVVPALTRVLTRLLVAWSALLGGPSRTSTAVILAAVGQIVWSGRFDHTHELVVDDLFHLIVIIPRPWNTIDRRT